MILFEEAYGFANVERQIRTTPQTMHLVASVAKPFTSAALMILAERGRINLHGPINAYVGESTLIAYRGSAADATVARMMMHTTGLPYGYYICGDEVAASARRTNKELLAISGVLTSAPGTRYEYTNIGYGVLEDVIGEVAGVNMKEFIRDEILTPLGLEHTGYFRELPALEKVATQNVDGQVLPIAFGADGYSAMYSTAGDLVRFGTAQLATRPATQRQILRQSSFDALWQHHEPAVECSTRRIGWDVQNDWGFEAVQHGGGGPGIHNWLYLIPSENVVVAIMSNAWYSNAGSNPVLIDLIGAALSESGRAKLRPGAGRGYARPTEIDPDDFEGEWSGSIKGPKGTCAIDLTIDSRGRPKLRLAGGGGGAGWIAPNRGVAKGHKTLLWRFDTSIPYLTALVPHDAVILTVHPEGNMLIGSASAAKEKNFGKGENYVLPQFVELAPRPKAP